MAAQDQALFTLDTLVAWAEDMRAGVANPPLANIDHGFNLAMNAVGALRHLQEDRKAAIARQRREEEKRRREQEAAIARQRREEEERRQHEVEEEDRQRHLEEERRVREAVEDERRRQAHVVESESDDDDLVQVLGTWLNNATDQLPVPSTSAAPTPARGPAPASSTGPSSSLAPLPESDTDSDVEIVAVTRVTTRTEKFRSHRLSLRGKRHTEQCRSHRLSLKKKRRAVREQQQTNDHWHVQVPTDADEECAICLESLRERTASTHVIQVLDQRVEIGRCLTYLECGHRYHAECYDEWHIGKAKKHCPYCRQVSSQCATISTV